MATSTTTAQDTRIALDLIDVPQNVRDLDGDHVNALAGSIAVQGILVPVVVRQVAERFELVAGFHRIAAARQLALDDVPAVIRDGQLVDSDRAVENIARKALSPYEEARAVKAMLDRGLTEDGAAQALGWPKARVTARTRILELPERAQQMIGTGQIALSGVDHLRAVGKVSPPLLDAVIEFLADGNDSAAERLAREPDWVLAAAIRASRSSVFATHLSQATSHDISGLRLGKKTENLYAEAEKLHKQLDAYAWGAPPVRFTDADVDQARAAGVLIEFDRATPIIVDRSLYREIVKGAITRTVEDLGVKAAERAKQRAQDRKRTGGAVDPVAEANRERDRQLRDLADQAHGVNLDLGRGLLTGLSTVDPADVDVARFFAYALLGADYTAGYGQAGERIHHLAVAGIRLVTDELRADVTKTRKDGSRGRLKMDYGNPREPEAALKWLWRYVDGAKTAGEIYGRALVVIAAEQYAARMVLPASQRTYRTSWGSHKGIAAKALKKIAEPHLPASLAQLERAVARAHKQAETAARTKPRATASDSDVDQAVEADGEWTS
jgi:ParB/RepB/Spo0J family partition protein